MKRFCCKISVQTIVITTIVAFVVFALGLVLNYSLKDYDKSECNVINRINRDETTKNNVVGRSEISALARAISITVASSTSLPDNDSNSKIIGLVLVCTLFTVFYLMIIVCWKRRQNRLRKQPMFVYNNQLENDVQNISTNIQGNKIDWMNLPITIV